MGTKMSAFAPVDSWAEALDDEAAAAAAAAAVTEVPAAAFLPLPGLAALLLDA